MRPSIRDETGDPLFGVEPAKILEWALRPWTPEELAEFKEFVLAHSELAYKRAEKRILVVGGCQLKLKGINGHTYWTPSADIFSRRRYFPSHADFRYSGVAAGSGAAP